MWDNKLVVFFQPCIINNAARRLHGCTGHFCRIPMYIEFLFTIYYCTYTITILYNFEYALHFFMIECTYWKYCRTLILAIAVCMHMHANIYNSIHVFIDKLMQLLDVSASWLVSQCIFTVARHQCLYSWAHLVNAVIYCVFCVSFTRFVGTHLVLNQQSASLLY